MTSTLMPMMGHVIAAAPCSITTTTRPTFDCENGNSRRRSLLDHDDDGDVERNYAEDYDLDPDDNDMPDRRRSLPDDDDDDDVDYGQRNLADKLLP